jgi:peroxiredoxin
MLDAGERAPPFELPDLEGKPHSLDEARAKGPVLVAFWKSTCGTCHLAFPYLQRLAQAYSRDRWTLLGVSQDGVEQSARFAEQHGLTFPTLIEGEGWTVSKAYDPEATPTLFFIDREGKIEMTSVGFDKSELNQLSRRIANHVGAEYRVIADAADGNPPFKPG